MIRLTPPPKKKKNWIGQWLNWTSVGPEQLDMVDKSGICDIVPFRNSENETGRYRV